MRYVVFFVLSWFLIPFFTFAHGNNYLEFSPDKTSSLRVIDVATPSQVFYAQNDFVGGFDIWVANPGETGTATFTLLNDQGSTLTSKTVSIPYLAETSNGTKLHVDFNSQVTVLADDKYSIKVTSLMPELRLYYSDRVQLVSHNAPFVSPYITGVARLGSEEQTFSFKYALYETTESSVPIISSMSWVVVSNIQMRAEFNANEPVDYKIEYGPVPSAGGSGQEYTQSTSFIGGYQLCAEGIAICSINISVLPNTIYQYRLMVKDFWGNQGQLTGTFSSGQEQMPTPTPTLSPASIAPVPSVPSVSTLPDYGVVPPIISNLQIVEVTNNSVSVAWTTDEIANSHLLISTPFLIKVTESSDPTMELEHFLKINKGLSSNTSYLATVTSIDQGSNGSRASISFRTLLLSASPTPSPQSSPTQLPTAQSSQQSGEVEISSSSADGGRIIQWSAPTSGEPSNGYRIDIFDQQGNLKKTVIVSDDLHRIEIPNLKNGEYSVIVYANNKGVFEKVDTPKEFFIEKKSFIENLSIWLNKFLPYLLIALGILAMLARRLFRSKASQTSQPPVS